MYIEQLYTNCLAEAAYYIESEGEAAIVDPIRETEQYVQLAASRGAKIKYIFETHFHADFVSGHLDLHASTGAPIVFGPGAETDFPIHQAQDGERFTIGKIEIETLHTPGHTPESSCYLLYDESGKAHALFSGDTLFVGDVGRPDLLDGKITKEALAKMMYRSLRTKINPLPDDVLLYPAHGPGSACGKNIGKETWSTLAKQKATNYALQPQTEEEFVKVLTTGLVPPPRYYFDDAKINKTGYAPLQEVTSASIRSLSLHELDSAIRSGAIVLDTRRASAFESGYIPNSVNAGLDGNFAWYVGAVLDISTPLVIVAEPGTEHESVVRLARIGYDRVLGYLEGGFAAWKNSGRHVETIDSIEPQEFVEYQHKGYLVLDVRNPGEFANGHVEDALPIPLAVLPQQLERLPKDQQYLIHCAGGYRSMIAASLMKRAGFERVTNVHGGFGKMKAFIEVEA